MIVEKVDCYVFAEMVTDFKDDDDIIPKRLLIRMDATTAGGRGFEDKFRVRGGEP
jgi:hypothetical protein